MRALSQISIFVVALLAGCAHMKQHVGFDGSVDLDIQSNQAGMSVGTYYTVDRCAAYLGLYKTGDFVGQYTGIGCSVGLGEILGPS